VRGRPWRPRWGRRWLRHSGGGLVGTVTVYKRQRCSGGRVGYNAEAVSGGREAVQGTDHSQRPPAREGPPGNHHLAIDSSFIRLPIMALGRF
jgi:hypothetical protein